MSKHWSVTYEITNNKGLFIEYVRAQSERHEKNANKNHVTEE